ncbi:MAG: nucleotidyltransferase family protein [Planctomycetota bacterium]|nr:nucleotidyltransferase family protein [Planctomycetota bacterium]
MSHTPLSPAASPRVQARWLRAIVGPCSSDGVCASVAAGPHPADLPDYEQGWEPILGRVEAEGLGPHFARLLEGSGRPNLPKSVADALRRSAMSRSARTLVQVEALRCVTDDLSRAGIPALSFKGPALACVLTGEPSGREYSDLDVLVPRAQRQRASEVLRRLGYVADAPLAQGSGSTFRHACAMAFRHAHGVSVDLHWGLASPLFPLRLSWLGLVRRSRRVRVADFEVMTFGPEDTLLHLCMHGAKDDWAYWSALADIAGLLAAERGLDFDLVRGLATKAGTRRVLRVGLLLATRVALAPLPRYLRSWAHHDATAVEIAREAEERLLAGGAVDQSIHARLRRAWRTRERYSDRLTAVLGAAVRVAEPRGEEASAWGWLRAPGRLLRDLRSDARPPLGGADDTSRGIAPSEAQRPVP